jgi:cytochrome b6-f complex iron-sulfur subunit
MNGDAPAAFPSTAGDRAAMTRRRFVQIGLGAAGAGYAAALGYPLYAYLAAPAEEAAAEAAVKEVTLPEADQLPVGAALMFKFGGRPAMLIHHRDGTWTALSAVCTHLGCTVQYEAERNRIYCACHGGVYDAATGANVSGPPPKPLRLFQARPTEGGMIVSRA